MPHAASIPIYGQVAPGFKAVESAFRRNFAERDELGAACAAYYRGVKVVDLWGGYRDRARQHRWAADTLVPVFSSTKGMASMALVVAHARGLFDYDAPVATYWPAFAQQGKETITVRQLLAHQAGLCAIDERLDVDTLADLDALAEVLARQKPAWAPGARHGYHGITLGWYEGELIRQIDPQHRSLGRFFQEEIAQPLGLEFYIGTPDHVPTNRIAEIKDYHPLRTLLHLKALPWRFVLALANPYSLTSRAFRNPTLKRPGDMASPPMRALEIPASNGVGLVRSMAKAYGALAIGGGALGLTAETFDLLVQPPQRPCEGWFDEVLKAETAYAFGYMRPFPGFRFGSEQAFGAPGMGGSFGFADPAAEIGYAYAPNRSGFYLWDDPRELALRKALYRSLPTTPSKEKSGSKPDAA